VFSFCVITFVVEKRLAGSSGSKMAGSVAVGFSFSCFDRALSILLFAADI
jgi:hypothetical protein